MELKPPNLFDSEGRMRFRVLYGGPHLGGDYNKVMSRVIDAGGHVVRSSKYVREIDCSLQPDKLQELIRDFRVLAVMPDTQVHICGERFQPASPMAQVPWGIRASRAIECHEEGVLGEGQTVCILDTGIDWTHPDLRRNIVDVWSEVDGVPNPFDGNGHGTHCAGVVGASGDQCLIGMAPRCNIIACKVMSDEGWGWQSDIDDGFSAATERGANITSCSFGGTGSAIAPPGILVHWYRGVNIAASLGNEFAGGYMWAPANKGTDWEGNPVYTPKNIYEVTDRRDFPWAPFACQYEMSSEDPSYYGYDWQQYFGMNSYGMPGGNMFNNIIGASALCERGNRAAFSSTGLLWHILAPGHKILSTLPHNSYGMFSGTSMSAPHIAGALALLRCDAAELSYNSMVAKGHEQVSDPYHQMYMDFETDDAWYAMGISWQLAAYANPNVYGWWAGPQFKPFEEHPSDFFYNPNDVKEWMAETETGLDAMLSVYGLGALDIASAIFPDKCPEWVQNKWLWDRW